MQSIEERFLNIRVNIDSENGPALHKPLLLLFAIGQLLYGKDRMISFADVDIQLSRLLGRFYPQGSLKSNTHYPFGKLENDGIWEVEKSNNLKRTSAGYLLKGELLLRNIHGSFTLEIFNTMKDNKILTLTIAKQLVNRFFNPGQHAELLGAVGITVNMEQTNAEIQNATNSGYHIAEFKPEEVGEEYMEIKQNKFIAYLNSLHNLGANGSNALAESQALSPYFGEIYEPFPLIDQLDEALTGEVERVIILTGHAGDGKSTIALDVLRKLRGLPKTQPLTEPLKSREDIDTANGRVTLIKDMSELSAEERRQWLHQAFKESGNWLIVSNTGPLLHSLVEYARQNNGDWGMESKILHCLDQPLDNGQLDKHRLNGFGKELLILNLTRLDNVALGASVLKRLVAHSGWGDCAGCSVEPSCPLMLNRKALSDAMPEAEERVRWIYQRLNAYEQRLTLRQIVAQLAFGLTGGMSCDEARQQAMASTVEGLNCGGAGLERILFSEGFFGYSAGKPYPQAEGLHAVALTHRAIIFGAPIGVNFERRLLENAGIGWAMLPPSLDWISDYWRQKAVDAAGVRWRFALRRMAYLFGKAAPGEEQLASVFLDAFVQSPSLRQFDQWRAVGNLSLSRAEAKHLHTACLRVLLEIFSGFSAGQFSKHDSLYLTLRRPDQAVVQPTQLVIKILSSRDFDLHMDPLRRMPVLRFRKGQVELLLTLPLLDYIRRRDAGELGNELSPIHQAQLDRFEAELLQAAAEIMHDEGEIELLRVGINGEVRLHRFFLDKEQGMLEQE